MVLNILLLNEGDNLIYQGRQLRNELKYAINNLEYSYIKSRLKTIMTPDENADENGEYHIRSLYFDDLTNSSYHEKEAGVLYRKKFRIRTYNKSDSIIRMELKEKFGKYISKTSSRISKDLYYEIFENELDISSFNSDMLLLKFYTEMKMNVLRPVVIVDYI